MTVKTSPLVSVIVPVYNAESYLDACLDSLCRQTLREIEIICVNDGSTDGSAAKLEQWAQRDPRIKVFSQENQGIGPTRNVGLRQMSAPYVGFVDADDWLEPTAFSAAVCPLSADPSIDLALWGHRYALEPGLDESYASKMKPSAKLKGKGKTLLSGDRRLKIDKEVWSKLYKASIIRDHQIDFPDAAGENVFFVLKYLAHARYGFYFKDLFYNYRIHPLSTINPSRGRKDGSPLFINLVAPEIFRYYKEKGLWDDNQAYLADLLADAACRSYDRAANPEQVLTQALALAEEYGVIERPYGLIRSLKRGRPPYPPKHSLLEKIASVKNQGDRKVFCFLGLKLSIPHSRGLK